MKCVVILFSITALIVGYVSGAPQVKNGYEAQKGDVPSVVSIQKNGKHICGGVILTERWIVTAAHCVKESAGVSVLAGIIDLQSVDADRQEVTAEKVVLHPEYKHGDHHNIENNLALIKLSQNLKFNKYVSNIQIMPASDLESAIKNRAVGQIAGWGSDEVHHHDDGHHHHVPSRYLNLAQINLLTHEECKADVKCHEYDDATNLCSGPLTGPKSGVSHMDDGGPLIINDKLAGVILHGVHEHPDEKDCHQSSLYTNIEYFKKFIDQTIQKQ